MKTIEDKTKENINSFQSLVDKVATYNKQSHSLLRKDSDLSLELAQNAEILARSIPYPLGVATALTHQTASHHILGDYYTALKTADEAIKIYESIDEKELKSLLLTRIAGIYADLGDLPQGLKRYIEALDYYQSTDNLSGQASLLCKVGILHSMAGDSHLAIENYLRSIEIYRNLGEYSDEARVYNSCCVDYTIIGDYQQAQINGERSIELFKREGDQYGVGVATSSLGEVALAKGDYKVAIDRFEQAIDLCYKAKINLASAEVLETLLNLAKAYHLSGDLEFAKKHLQTVLNHAEDKNLTPLAMRCHRRLSSIYEESEDMTVALFHLKKHLELREMIFSQKNEKELHSLQVIHKTKEAQAESKRLKTLRENDLRHFHKLNQIKDDFLHNATHDIKNPLLIINTSIYLLKAKFNNDDPTFNKHLDQINEQSKRILGLVEGILDLAKLESAPTNNKAAIDLKEWLQSITNRFKTLAESKRIDLSVSTEPNNLIGTINKQRLEQAIENILSNALKYTKQGGRVQLTAHRVDSELQIKIKDNGIGIPQDSIPYLFDRFYRVNHQISGTEEIEGTGLGLSIAKLSAEQQGGSIRVESQIGEGSIFSIHLPQ